MWGEGEGEGEGGDEGEGQRCASRVPVPSCLILRYAVHWDQYLTLLMLALSMHHDRISAQISTIYLRLHYICTMRTANTRNRN